MLHDAESDLCQKLLTRNDFPGAQLIMYILENVDGRTWKKCFLILHLKDNLLIYILNGTFEF